MLIFLPGYQLVPRIRKNRVLSPKTTILYKLHIGEVISTVPTIGGMISCMMKQRALWRHYFNNMDSLLYTSIAISQGS
ncbi:ADP-ribosylation factor, putative [Medicago truncatula]|uniref:ADP-ribosylation factor, putative n=1 Tax=Medicago truncatula TaxID=3880 RepID=G7INL8_MEDTR|nr:ADP-ribosylation factor, putative [Medicago truncatula]